MTSGGRTRSGLVGRAVLVTGASSGIGRAAVGELAAAGFEVFGSVRRSQDGTAVEAAGGQPVELDVTEAGSVRCLGEELTAGLTGRPLHGLVANAGVAIAGPWEELAMEDIERVLETNFLGAVRVTRAVLPLMRPAPGRIVAVSSFSVRVAAPFVGPYVASKVALEAFCESLRRELQPQGIGVSVVEPASIRTPLWEKLRRAAPRSLPPASPYAASWERFLPHVAASERRGLPVERVARAIRRALTARRPPRRLVVARGGRLAVGLFSLLPGRLLDRLIARRIHGR